jgi:hypothetical protein
MPPFAFDVSKEEVSFVHAMALTTQAQSQGSNHAVNEPTREPPIVVENDDNGKIVADDTVEQEPSISDFTVRDLEPDHEQLNLEE